MEAFHPTPVVPSNAPLWADIDQDPRILRGQCGNRQLGHLQTQNIQNYYANPNIDSTCGSVEFIQNKYDPHSQRLFNDINRNLFRGSGRILDSNREKDIKAELEARRLASKFAYCEGYQKYRNRQPKEKKGGKDDAKWPDHIEDAFIIALCRHPPCGRKQAKAPGEEHNDDAKALGRNELIADYIFRATGDVRTRKQVSSHIQVLKPFVQHEPSIMRFLATSTKKQSAAVKQARKRASVYNPGIQSHIDTHHHNFSLQTIFDLQPDEFCMFMRPPKASETLHTYSSTQDTVPSTYFVHSEAELYDRFPSLTHIPAEQFNNSKTLALHVPIVLHPKDLVGDIELAIRWVFRAPARYPSVSVSSRTRFYLNGRPIYCDKQGNRQFYDNQNREMTEDMEADWRDFTKEYDAAEVSEQNDTDSKNHYASRHLSGGGMVQYYVPFSSTFWARYLWHVASLQTQANNLETRPLQHAESNEERDNQLHTKRLEVASALGQLTAVQDIIAKTSIGEPQVVMTVHFSFSHAASKEDAVTTWQYLDMSDLYDAVMPMSAGAVSEISQSASDSQESGLSVQGPYGGGSHDYASFDFSIGGTGLYKDTKHGYSDPSNHSATALASPIDLHDTQATAGYSTSWLLPTPNTDLNHLTSTVLDPLLPHTSQPLPQSQVLHDVNSFDFTNGNISISLDSSSLSTNQPPPHSSATFSTAIDALDLDFAATDPLLLQPSRNTTPWMQSSATTPTEYGTFFSQPHSPAVAAFPEYGSTNGTGLADHLATVTGGLTDGFDVSSLPNQFSLSAHQAFAGAGNTSRQQSFSTGPETERSLGAEADVAAGRDSNRFSPIQSQGFGYTKTEFSQHDGFALPQQQQEKFDDALQNSFNSNADAFASQTDTRDFAHSFDVNADGSFDVNDLHVGRSSQTQSHRQQHQETWAGAGF